jgi:hypothetical protein
VRNAQDHAPETLRTGGKTITGSLVRALMFLLLAATTLAYATEVQPGDQVRFIERDQHIPAHPAPGDTRVHLRFIRGSQATVTEFIDHLVVDRRVLPWADRTSFRQGTYSQADEAVWARLSDHCPALVELWIR